MAREGQQWPAQSHQTFRPCYKESTNKHETQESLDQAGLTKFWLYLICESEDSKQCRPWVLMTTHRYERRHLHNYPRSDGRGWKPLNGKVISTKLVDDIGLRQHYCFLSKGEIEKPWSSWHHFVLDLDFTMYHYSLNTNDLNDETHSLLPAHLDFQGTYAHFCRAPLSMKDAAVCRLGVQGRLPLCLYV